MNSLPDEILSRILFLAATPHNGSEVDAAASDAEPSVDSDVSPCHGMGMVSKRWASLLPVVRITAAADMASRPEDSDDQDDSLLPASTLSAPALFRALFRAPSVTSLTLGDGALDFYDHHFLTSLLAACPNLTCVSLGEPCFKAAPPPFTIGLAPLDSFFRAVAPQLQELALLLPVDIMKLPDSISSLSSLRVLRLRANELQRLPEGLCHLPALQELRLSCRMLELPENLGRLKALRHLAITRGGRNLFPLPETLSDLASLTSLRIDGWWNVQLPSGIGALQQLRRLELRHLDGELPDACNAWANLEEVSLDRCSMRSLPPTWLQTLTRLTLRSCDHLESLPIPHVACDSPLRHLTLEGVGSTVPLHPLSRLTSLQRLKVSGSRSRGNVNADFPVGLFSLPSLSHLHLTDVFLPSPPPRLTRLLSLRKLRISSAHIPHAETFMPENIGELAALEWLELEGRVWDEEFPPLMDRVLGMIRREEPQHLPQEFGSCGAPTNVTTEGSSPSLPDTLSSLSSLQEASLSTPVFASLPPSSCLLSRLHTLAITGSDCLVTLPADFGSLGALQRLSIHSCSHLQSLPESFSSLISLVRLTITLPCHGMGMVSKRWASLLPVVRITAAADMASRPEDSDDQDDSLLPASTLSAPALFRALFRAPSVTSLTLGDGALDFYDHHFLTSLLAACPNLTCVSLGEPCFKAAPPPFTIGLAPLDSFFRAVAPQLQELALLLPVDIMKLPDSISSLSSLRVLRLRANELQRLPEGLCHLPALQELRLSCRMLELPENLGRLKALRHLAITRGGRNLFPLPETLSDLASLTSLRIDGWWNVQLPSGIGALQQLRRLELRHLDGELPDACNAWANLEEVSLDRCSMRSLPPTWLQTLTRLTLRSCDHLESLPIPHVACDSPLRHLTLEGVGSTVPLHPLSRLTSLQRLKVSGSRSRGNVNADFPVGLFSLPSLSHLHLTDVFLPSPPPRLTRLLSLRKLRISSAHIPHAETFMTENIGELAALEWLELEGRVWDEEFPPLMDRVLGMIRREEPQHLPQEFGSCGAPTNVTTEGSSPSLPDTLSSLSSLQEASLSTPVFASLPPSCCLLSRLHTLAITGSDCLVTLPADFGSLGALQRLSIHSCSHLQSLPDSFSSLISLVRLTITLPCHGMGMVSKRWASLLPVVRITAAADMASRPEDSDDQDDSLLPASTLSAPALFRALFRAPSVTSLTLGDGALDFYDHHFLTSLLAACPNLTCVSLGEPCFKAAPPPFTIGLAPLDSFFRAVAPQLQELALLLPVDIMKLPDSISSLSSLRVLRLRANELQWLPEGLCHLPALQELRLSCRMLELPENLGRLKALRHLAITRGGRNLFPLPETLSDLASLTSLRIDGWWNVQLPSGIGALQQLRRLELRHLDGELPDACNAWANLEEVSLDRCSMRSLPPTWLQTLTRLTLRSCDHLESLPIPHVACDSPLRHLTLEGVGSTVPLHPLSRLTSLQRLKVSGSRSRGNVNADFPVGLFSLPSLSHLHLTDVFLPSPPPRLTRLLSLRKLRISSAHIPHAETFMPENIGELAALEWLELEGRVWDEEFPPLMDRVLGMIRREEPQHLPQEFGSCGAPTNVTTEGSSPSLPDTLSSLSSLQEASLSTPVFASLPPSCCLLSRLHTLAITGSDCLVTLPADFGSLGALQRLSIHSCSHLQSLPDSFSSLISLVRLTITLCPNLSNLPDGFGSLPRLAWLTINDYSSSLSSLCALGMPHDAE
ncbi:unnamed protein product [Closterium sp. Naga37s-1]|nr:unnamed protein product [Closterium sp. Naga37s-1]